MPGTAQSGGRSRGKTRAAHELAGTFRKDRHEALSTPQPPAGRPDAPVDLPEVAQAEWDRMLWRLDVSQSLVKVDDASIYQYCRLYAETEAVSVLQAETAASVKVLEENIREVEKADLVAIYQEIGNMRKLVSKCTDQLRQGRMAIRQYLVEFGLTPASRGRVRLPAKKAETDEFTAFQQKRAM